MRLSQKSQFVTVTNRSIFIICQGHKVSLYTGQVAHQAGAYPSFLSMIMKGLGVVLLPPWMGC